MRLYSISPIPVQGAWSAAYRIAIDDHSMPNYGDLDRYLRDNFKDNYILIARLSQIIAGGSTNNKIHCPDRVLSTDYYELRCSSRDAKAFMKVWKLPKKRTKKC